MKARRYEEPDIHLAPPEVRRRIVLAIERSAREKAGLPARPGPSERLALARVLRAWRKRALPLF